MKAVYYKTGSYEHGLMLTGNRNSNYTCWCYIYDENKKQIIGHHLEDRFTGKWAKCSTKINKWTKGCIANNLTQKLESWQTS